MKKQKQLLIEENSNESCDQHNMVIDYDDEEIIEI